MSRPTRARGLKLAGADEYSLRNVSRPTRARGLKRNSQATSLTIFKVAPHAGAWIETRWAESNEERSWCRAPRGRVD